MISPSDCPQVPAPAAIDSPAPPVRNDVEPLLGPTAVFEMSGQLPAFRIDAKAIHEACRKVRDAGFDYLVFVTAVDYAADGRMEVIYVLSSYSDGRQFALVTDLRRDDPRIETVSDLWETADWHEREIYDLFGIRFDNHPDLRRILLDDTWDGHPLRKDYEDKVHGVIKRPSNARAP